MTREASRHGDDTKAPDVTDRLDSWKDIATYLKRDVTTVQRWERREGLPIHRQQHDKLGSVYAFRHEIDAWRAARSRRLEAPGDSASDPDAIPASEPETRVESKPLAGPATIQSKRRVWLFAAAGVTAIVVTMLATWLTYRQTGSGPSLARPDIRSIVVLPLENLSGDSAEDFFAAGLTEELTDRLAQLKTLRVISRTSAMSLRDRRIPVSTIARELNVDAVIEGSVRREGGRVRISIQLIHAPTDTHLWARDFERETAATWPLQIEVAQAVADEIRVQATPGGASAPGSDAIRQSSGLRGVPARAPFVVEVHRRGSGACDPALQSSDWT